MTRKHVFGFTVVLGVLNLTLGLFTLFKFVEGPQDLWTGLLLGVYGVVVVMAIALAVFTRPSKWQ